MNIPWLKLFFHKYVLIASPYLMNYNYQMKKTHGLTALISKIMIYDLINNNFLQALKN